MYFNRTGQTNTDFRTGQRNTDVKVT